MDCKSFTVSQTAWPLSMLFCHTLISLISVKLPPIFSTNVIPTCVRSWRSTIQNNRQKSTQGRQSPWKRSWENFPSTDATSPDELLQQPLLLTAGDFIEHSPVSLHLLTDKLWTKDGGWLKELTNETIQLCTVGRVCTVESLTGTQRPRRSLRSERGMIFYSASSGPQTACLGTC